MACCIVAAMLLSQLYALWCRLRAAMGFPVRQWYDDSPVPTARAIWGERLRLLMRSNAARSVVATLALGELAFLLIALPGPDGLIAQHRRHLRQAVELAVEYGSLPRLEALVCRLDPSAKPAVVAASRSTVPPATLAPAR